MGSKDLYQSDFFENLQRFSDLFNGILFAGQEVIKPEELESADTTLVSIFKNDSGKKVICDKVRKWKGRYLSLLVLENQSYVDYGMVFRAMRAELMSYEKQQKKAFEEGRHQGIPYHRQEYLSRMKKRQKFIPVVTLILYLGIDGPWDGARNLYEILEMDEQLKPFITNYRLNLYDYHEQKDFSLFKTENRALFELLSCADDKNRMKKVMLENRSRYRQLDEETAKAILGIAGVKVDLESIKHSTKEGKEGFDVCKAFDDYKLEGFEEGVRTGRKEGRKAGRKEGEFSARMDSLRNLMKNLNVSAEQAMELLGIPPDEKERYSQQQH